MINELYNLSKAMQRAHVSGRAKHRSYLPLPNVKKKAPCIQILLSGASVAALNSLPAETVSLLRKYGNNQGSYPAMNLAALYRISDQTQVKLVSDLIFEKETDFSLEQLKNFCQVNNWCPKFLKKYKNCMKKVPEELRVKLKRNTEHPIHQLISQTDAWQDPDLLHQALENKAFDMLEHKTDIPTALSMLFYLGDHQKQPEEDFGSLSVILDSAELRDLGYSTVSSCFTEQLNDALIQADADDLIGKKADCIDAFGVPFASLEEPMPSVKLAGGFTTSLRTMYHGSPCQYRYGYIENATYPISPQLRMELQSALDWISDASRKDQTWSSLNGDEILFAYPESLPAISPGLAAALHRTQASGEADFRGAARRFLENLRKAKDPGSDSRAERIQIFILKKLDKARCKIVYNHNTTPQELEQRSERWFIGCQNLPVLGWGTQPTIYPLDATDIMNWGWKRDATLTSSKFKPFHSYHGLELFFDDGVIARQDLSALLRNLEPAAPTLGQNFRLKDIEKLRQSFLLIGLLLDRLGSRKESYMQSYPYLYGQLLKVSDDLHALYCRAVRKDGQLPPQLVGGSVYNAAAELPLQTLAQLGQRMNPYIAWAKAYQYQNIAQEKQESWRARWYLSLYETYASQLAALPEAAEKTRFTDKERAQLFIGYLAAYPKKGKEENGGTEDEI